MRGVIDSICAGARGSPSAIRLYNYMRNAWGITGTFQIQCAVGETFKAPIVTVLDYIKDADRNWDFIVDAPRLCEQGFTRIGPKWCTQNLRCVPQWVLFVKQFLSPDRQIWSHSLPDFRWLSLSQESHNVDNRFRMRSEFCYTWIVLEEENKERLHQIL